MNESDLDKITKIVRQFSDSEYLDDDKFIFSAAIVTIGETKNIKKCLNDMKYTESWVYDMEVDPMTYTLELLYRKGE